MKTAALAILGTVKNQRTVVVYGMDTEYCKGETFARTLQILLLPSNGTDFKANVFDLNAASPKSSLDFPSELRRLLTKRYFILAGQQQQLPNTTFMRSSHAKMD